MEIILIIVGIFALYWRTQNYNYIIDDIVRRWGYLYEIPEQSPSPEFYSSKPHAWRHLFLSITHGFNVWVVYQLFGFAPALLFAFSPLSVPCAAWITGGYYSVTTLFTLASYFFLFTYHNFIGAGLSALFFAAALGSTITCIGFPFLCVLFNPWGAILFWPMMMYLKGRRFSKGYAIRDMGKQDSFSIKKIPVMVKTVAYYIYMVVFPYRLSFFRHFGEDYTRESNIKKDMESINGWFWLSLVSILAFIGIGCCFSVVGVFWFLVMIAPFSQFKVLGQFVAERYIYLPSIGWYLILGGALAPYPLLLWTVAALYLARSHFYIPAFKNIESLYEDGIRNEPRCLANYANLGERYIHMGRLLEGKNILQKGIDLDSDNFLCYTNTAAYWTQVKDAQRGIYYTEKAMALGQKKSSWFIVHAMREQMKGLHQYEKMMYKLTYPDIFEKKEEVQNVVAMG